MSEIRLIAELRNISKISESMATRIFLKKQRLGSEKTSRLLCRICYGVIFSHSAWNVPDSTSKKTGAWP